MTSYASTRKNVIKSAIRSSKMTPPSISFDLVFQSVSSGMVQVKVRASHLGKAILLDTDISVFPKDWNDSLCQVKTTHPRYKDLNNKLRKIVYDLEGFVLDHDGDCSLSMLKRAWEERLITTDFYEMFESKIESRPITESTKKIHRNVLRKLKVYKNMCQTHELTDDLFEDFINWCKKDVCEATAEKYVQILKCYYNIARDLYGESVPYCNFEWHKNMKRKQFKIKALSEEDVRKIETFVLKPNIKDSYRLAMQRFLFLSYTGMRISDFMACDKSKFAIEDGVMWLTYTSVKTHTLTRVPISVVFDGRASDILTAHEDDLDSFFNIGDRCHYNEKVKKICKKIIGIEHKVTTHCGRHTFATRLVNKEVPITTIAKVCGHNKIETTMIYARTTKDAMIKQLSC